MQHRDEVVVITGASSGIGRATARAFAERGSALVLAARAEERLGEVEAECAGLGARVIAVEADVSRNEDVERLAQRAVDAFGGFNVWVNNAGVIAFGRIDETPAEDHEQIIRTNLCGCLFGARMAIKHFRGRERGTLINVSSLASRLGQTYSTAYTASKWGVTGLGQALRAELADETGIHVCTVMPGYIDTPLFEHAANYMDRPAQPMSPVYAPERVAAAIVGVFCHADVADEASVDAALATARAAHGVERVLVNCAGIAPGRRTVAKNRDTGEVVAHDLATFRRTVEVNLIGTFHMLAKSAAAMAGLAPVTPDGGRGVVVCTASIAAQDGQIGQAAYAASKAGVLGLTLPVARDLAGFGIRVVTIMPGLFRTPMLESVPDDFRRSLEAGIPFPSRLGRPEEYAELVRAIVANDMLNGEAIRLDGALRMPPK